MTRPPAVRRFPGLLLITAVIAGAADTRADDEALTQSPTAEERQAAAALDAIGASLRINGQYQIVSVSLLANGELVTNDVLAHISRLKHLQSLSVAGPQITDDALQQFAELKRLTSLALRDVAATDEGIARLQAALPDCRIRRSPAPAAFAAAPNGVARQRVPAAAAAQVAEARAAALAEGGQRGFRRAVVVDGVVEIAGASGRAYVPSIYFAELLKTDAQIEIELTSQQWDALQNLQADGAAATEELSQKLRGLREQPAGTEQDQLRESLQAEIEQLTAAAEERIKVLLSAEQYQRLQQLAWHSRGPLMLMDAAFAAELRLDDAQRARIEALRGEQRQRAAQRAGADPRTNAARPRGIGSSIASEEWREQLLAVLTAEQRAAYEQKLGPSPESDAARIGQHVFALLDTDGDEQLAAEEWGSPDAARLLSSPRSRIRATLPLGRAEFVRVFVSLREQPRGLAVPR